METGTSDGQQLKSFRVKGFLKRLKAVAAQLEDEDCDFQQAALEVLEELTLEILDQRMVSLYQTSLERSFNEHLTWYIMDGISYIPIDFRETPLKDQLDNNNNKFIRPVTLRYGVLRAM